MNKTHLAECAQNGVPESECSLIDKLIGDFKSVKIFWIVIVCLAFMISNILRAFRWNQLLEPLGYKPKIFNGLGSIMLGYLTNMAIPRIGEVVRAGSLSKYENIPTEKIFGTIVVDRILDVVSLLVMIGLAFLLSYDHVSGYISEMSNISGSNLLIGLLVLAILGLMSLWLVKKLILDVKSKKPFVQKIQKLVTGFKDGLLAVLKVKNIPMLILNSIGIWLMYYLMIYFCFFAFEPTSHLGPVAALIAFVFGTFGIVIPSPGGVGTYQWLVSEALVIYGVNKIEAFSFANIMFFTIQIFCNIAFGVLFYLAMPFYNKVNNVQ